MKNFNIELVLAMVTVCGFWVLVALGAAWWLQ